MGTSWRLGKARLVRRGAAGGRAGQTPHCTTSDRGGPSGAPTRNNRYRATRELLRYPRHAWGRGGRDLRFPGNRTRESQKSRHAEFRALTAQPLGRFGSAACEERQRSRTPDGRPARVPDTHSHGHTVGAAPSRAWEDDPPAVRRLPAATRRILAEPRPAATPTPLRAVMTMVGSRGGIDGNGRFERAAGVAPSGPTTLCNEDNSGARSPQASTLVSETSRVRRPLRAPRRSRRVCLLAIRGSR